MVPGLGHNGLGHDARDGIVAGTYDQVVQGNTEADKEHHQLNDRSPRSTKTQGAKEGNDSGTNQDNTSKVGCAASEVQGCNTVRDNDQHEHGERQSKSSEPKVFAFIVLAHAVNAAQEHRGDNGGQNVEPKETGIALQIIGRAAHSGLLFHVGNFVYTNIGIAKNVGVKSTEAINVLDTHGGKASRSNHNNQPHTNNAGRLEGTSKSIFC